MKINPGSAQLLHSVAVLLTVFTIMLKHHQVGAAVLAKENLSGDNSGSQVQMLAQ